MTNFIVTYRHLADASSILSIESVVQSFLLLFTLQKHKTLHFDPRQHSESCDTHRIDQLLSSQTFKLRPRETVRGISVQHEDAGDVVASQTLKNWPLFG